MTVSITNESKNTVSLSLESRVTSLTWGEASFPSSQAAGTWGNPGSNVIEESKNTVSVTLESR
jgi:hypothetical protein